MIEMYDRAMRIHRDSIVVDCLTGTFSKDFNEQYVQNLKKGGISAIHVTIPDIESYDMSQVVDEFGKWFRVLRGLEQQNVRIATSVKDVREIKEAGGIGVVLGSQGAGFLGLDLGRLHFFARLGMRMWQATYQQRNQIGGGCGEKVDVGLSNFGFKWVEEVNKLGIVISLSHVGYRTSMEVMESSKDPVVFDHSNAKALCDHIRNITDEQIRACAEKGGVIGLTPTGSFVSAEKKMSQIGVEDYVDHIDYVVDLVGVDHAGIGLDLCEGQFWTHEQLLEERRRLQEFLFTRTKQRQEVEDEFLKSERDKLYQYEVTMPWLKSVSEVPMITENLLCRGYSNHDVKKIMGQNFLRVFERVWKS